MSNEALFALIKKHPISFGCGLLSLVLVVTIYFRRDKITEAETALAQKTEEGERYRANIKNSGQLQEQLDTLLAARKEIDARIIRANQLGANSQIFFKLESQTGVKLMGDPRQSAPAAKGPGAFVPVGFSVSMTGELPQLLSALRTLESGTNYCRVLGATCALDGTDRRKPLLLNLNLELLGVP